MPDLIVPDISEWQGPVDHPTVAAWLRAQCGGAVIVFRASLGAGAQDRQIEANLSAADLYDAVGLYCYLLQDVDAGAQAAFLCRVIQAHGGLRPNWFLAVDDEEGGGDQSPRVTAFLDHCGATIHEAAGQDWWYSGLFFSRAHLLAHARGHRWLAAYTDVEMTDQHDLWQRTSSARIPGIAGAVDCSVYHGTIADFRTLIGGDDMYTDADRARDQATAAMLQHLVAVEMVRDEVRMLGPDHPREWISGPGIGTGVNFVAQDVDAVVELFAYHTDGGLVGHRLFALAGNRPGITGPAAQWVTLGPTPDGLAVDGPATLGLIWRSGGPVVVTLH